MSYFIYEVRCGCIVKVGPYIHDAIQHYGFGFKEYRCTRHRSHISKTEYKKGYPLTKETKFDSFVMEHTTSIQLSIITVIETLIGAPMK